MIKLALLLLGSGLAGLAEVAGAASANLKLDAHALDMFNTAIEWNDGFWDENAGYLVAAASNRGRYDSRHTGWYATQLLARNGPGDVARAIRIFDNLISSQYLDPTKQWYGDYQQAPSEPQPGTTEYPNDGPYSSVSS
jgi:hypothetical protein